MRVVQIRVSSAMMSYGSPVFKAMLGNDFKEGRQLKTASRVEIQLPDDNARVMVIICQVLHLRHYALPADLSSSEILQVAALADKYDCVEALRFASQHWMSKRMDSMGTAMSTPDRVNMLAAACLLHNADVFRRMAQNLSMHTRGRVPLPNIGGQLAVVDETITRINDAKTACLREVAEFVEEIVEEQCCVRAAHDSTSRCQDSCTFAEVRSSALLLHLRAYKLWPVTQLEQFSLAELFHRSTKLEIKWPPNLRRCDGDPPFHCVANFAVSARDLSGIFGDKARHLAVYYMHAWSAPGLA
ncbi:hypothetical protein LTR85_003042 [Meristemomyces frigidus]|nr:hypothetical protein LTR85_003042 [Meristemomyces frigidus]